MLYQYRREVANEHFRFLRDLLVQGSMKFTRPSEFNDPFDCCPAQLAELPDGAFPNAVGDRLNHGLQQAISVIHGVACFSRYPDNMCMWSHYGDQHQGVCVGFDDEVLRAEVPTNDAGNPMYDGPVEITYPATRPGGGREAFTTKSPAWAYEHEYRLLSSMCQGEPIWGPDVWSIPKSAIKELVLGARMRDAEQKSVVELAREAMPDISIKKVVLSMKSFELAVEPLEEQPIEDPMVGHVRDPNGKWRDFGRD